jgi:hypothetical protein
MNLFEATTFPQDTIADFGQAQDGLKWYLRANIKMDWDLEQFGNDIAEILRNHYVLCSPESFECWPMAEIEKALEKGFPICALQDQYIVCTYLIQTSRMMILDFGDAKNDCKLIAKKLSEKYSYLTENVNQLELFDATQ